MNILLEWAVEAGISHRDAFISVPQAARRTLIMVKYHYLKRGQDKQEPVVIVSNRTV
jgi:hypothetical protein